jgi:hypothetical protein
MNIVSKLLAVCVTSVCCFSAAAVQAENAVVLQRETLHSEPFIDAPSNGGIDKDTQVEVIKRQGNWALVKSGTHQGWLRSLNLRSLDAAKAAVPTSSGVLALESGRSGSRELIATTGIRKALTPIAALSQIYKDRDDRRQVELVASKTTIKIGKENIELMLYSREAGYVYLVMLGSDGHSFDLLFPNKVDDKNVIQAGETLKLPRSIWPLTAQGPAGADTLLAIVAASPRDFSAAGMHAGGTFLTVDATPAAAKNMVVVAGTSPSASSAECTGGASAAARCSSAYGAALLTIAETK